MPNDEKPASRWQTPLAIATVVVSLFGNVIQCGMLRAKQKEVELAERKIADARQKGDDCRRAIDQQVSEFYERLDTLKTNLTEITKEINRLLRVSSVLTNAAQKQAGLQKAAALQPQRAQLEAELKELQNKIDVTVAAKSKCPSVE